jgi:hypothetical protein
MPRQILNGFFIVAAAALGLVMSATPAAAATSDNTAAQAARQDKSTALVQLNGEPLSTDARTRPAPGRKIDFNSNTVRSYRAQLAALRNGCRPTCRRRG